MHPSDPLSNGKDKFPMQPNSTCSIQYCNHPHRSRGWCDLHYTRWRRFGDPLVSHRPQIRTKGNPETRFWGKVDPCRTDNCMIWTGSKTKGGYGLFGTGVKVIAAHLFLVGHAPEGLEWDHLCVNPSCIYPKHLEAVTHSVNMRRIYERRATKTVGLETP